MLASELVHYFHLVHTNSVVTAAFITLAQLSDVSHAVNGSAVLEATRPLLTL